MTVDEARRFLGALAWSARPAGKPLMPYAAKTRVPVTQSRSEIEKLLEQHKAKQFGTAVDYDAN